MSLPNTHNFRLIPYSLLSLLAYLLGWILGFQSDCPPTLARWLGLAGFAASVILILKAPLAVERTASKKILILGFSLGLIGFLRGGSLLNSNLEIPQGPWSGVAEVSSLAWLYTPQDDRFKNPKEENRWTLFTTRNPQLQVIANGDHSDLTPGLKINLSGRIKIQREWKNSKPSIFRSPQPPVLWIQRSEGIRRTPETPPPLSLANLKIKTGLLRFHALRQLKELFDPNEFGILAALLLGERRGLPQEFKNQLLHTGTYHFLAISGLHLGVLLILFQRNRCQFVIKLLALLFIISITGAAPPILRAATMVLITWLVQFFHRSPRPLDGFSWSILFLVIIFPAWILKPGFQLSVAAVISILLWSSGIEEKLSPNLDKKVLKPEERKKLRKRLRPLTQLTKLFSGSFAAWLGTLPVLTFHFQRIHPLGVLWSLVIYPFILVLLFSGILSLLTATLHPALASPFVFISEYCIHGLNFVLRFLNQVPGSTLILPYSSFSLWLLASLFIFSGPFGGLQFILSRFSKDKPKELHFHLGLKKTHFTKRFFLLCLLAVLIVKAHKSYAPSFPLLTFFDVGAGSSILFAPDPDTRILIDAGSKGGGKRVARELSQTLLYRGVRHLDALILTHKDSDHISGVLDLCQTIQVSEVWTSFRFSTFTEGARLLSQLRKRGIRHRILKRGQSIQSPKKLNRTWKLETLSPGLNDPEAIRQSSNESSLVLKLKYDSLKVLLGADIEEQGTALLLMTGQDLRAQYLLLPHHGRANPYYAQLLETVRPKEVIISGEIESVSPNLLTLLNTHEIPIWITGELGAISIFEEEKGIFKIRTP